MSEPQKFLLWVPLFLALVASSPIGAAEPPDRDAEETGQSTPPTQQAAPGQSVFQGAITVSDRPILEGNEVDRYGNIVGTVSDQQIDDLYAQDLSAALRRVPGVVISRYNLVGSFGGGDGGAVFIRGHGSGRPGADIVTMTEGVPRFVGVWTHPLLDPLSIDTVRHVDIYRSAQPVLIGNMAFGALDITPKQRHVTGNGGRIVASYGTHDTVIGEVEYGGRSDRLDYYLTASHRSSDGHRMNSDGSVDAVSGRLGLRVAEGWDLSFRFEHTEGDVNDPGLEGIPPPPVVENYATNGNFMLANLGHTLGGWTGFIKFYYDAVDADWRQWDAIDTEQFVVVTESENYGVRIRETVAPWSGGELVLGLDHDEYGGVTFERRSGSDGRATDLRFRNTAPYLMLSHAFGGSVKITPSVGVRYNDSRYFGNEWGGQVGIKVGFGSHAAYANYAHGFNLPGVYAAALYSGWGRGDQWRQLSAEILDHVEVGMLMALGGSIRLDFSLYRDRVQDALRFVPPPPPPPLFANIGDYEVNGVEVSLQAQVSERLALFVGTTINDSDPEEVPNHPRSTAVGGLGYTGRSGWRVNFDLQWVDERYVLNPRFAPFQAKVDSYVLVNGKVEMPMRHLGIGVDGEVFLAGENLADVDYQYRIGYPMPGRTVNLGIDVRF